MSESTVAFRSAIHDLRRGCRREIIHSSCASDRRERDAEMPDATLPGAPHPIVCRKPTAADRLWFNCCRISVGIVVLGLTLLATLGSLTPALAEGFYSTPPEHTYNWTLWSSEDTEATHTMLLISGGQLILVGLCAAGCWLRHRRKQAQQAEQAAARREERRAKKRTEKARARLAAAEAARAVEV